MKLNTYMAVFRKVNFAKSFKIRFEATDNSTALSVMYDKANATSDDELIEYELYQELELNRYMSVAFKPTQIVPPQTKELVVVQRSEWNYIPYKLNAA